MTPALLLLPIISPIMIIGAAIRSTRIFLPRRIPFRPSHFFPRSRIASPYVWTQPARRTYVAKSTADEKIEEIQELYVRSLPIFSPHCISRLISVSSYATAKDEFEIATEETEKKTVYAADDRAAAQEELTKLKTAFADAVKGEGGEEINRRIGGRLRELERAVEALEERAMED